MNRQIIYVTGNEAQLIQAAEAVDANARSRADQAAEPGTFSPIVTYDSEMEQYVMHAKLQLEYHYQQLYHLECPPILVPQTLLSSQPENQRSLYHEARRKGPPSDMEMAQLLLNRVILRRIGERIYLFNGRYYERLSDDQFRTEIVRTLREELNIDGSSRQIKSVAAALMAEPEIEVNGAPREEAKLCLRNGVLDLRTLRLEPFSPAYFLTFQLQAEWLGEQSCPVFHRFLSMITGGDMTLAQRFLEVIGYLLLCPDNRAKRFILLQGCGDTGKSVLGRLIQSFFTSDQIGSVDIFKLGDRFSLAGLVNKRINISMDLTDASLTEQAAAVLKQITGGDLLMIEEKYKAPYASRIDCKLLFGTNHLLRLNSVDPALLRRVLYLPFQYPVPKEQQDPQLDLKLMAERSGILCYVIKAYRQLEARNFCFSGDESLQFQSVPQMGNALSQPSEETVAQFAESCCKADSQGFVPTEQLFECYQQYCCSISAQSLSSKQQFSTKLNPILQDRFGARKSKKRVNTQPVNGYEGICLIGTEVQ